MDIGDKVYCYDGRESFIEGTLKDRYYSTADGIVYCKVQTQYGMLSAQEETNIFDSEEELKALIETKNKKVQKYCAQIENKDDLIRFMLYHIPKEYNDYEVEKTIEIKVKELGVGVLIL